ncbi:hypothetical protein ABZP36_016141 [Zizania latifolia]
MHGSNLMRHKNLVIKPELIGYAWLRSHSSLDHVLAREDNCVTAALRRGCLRKDSSAHFLLAVNLQNIERKGLDMIRGMHIIIWDAATTTHDFTFYADRLMEVLKPLPCGSIDSSSTTTTAFSPSPAAPIPPPPHLLHSGPPTCAARQSSHKLVGPLATAAAGPSGLGAGNGKGDVDVIRLDGVETPTEVMPLVDEAFEAIRSRGAGVHVVPTFEGEASAP